MKDTTNAMNAANTTHVQTTNAWRIAIIDDSPDDRGEVRRLLLRGSDRQYKFVEAETAATGVLAVLKGEALPDCVILDFNLPDMEVQEVLQALAGADHLPVCPVVVLTGGAAPEAGRLVLRAGAQDYIAKEGLTALALTRIIENAIERLSMARELLAQNATLIATKKTLSEASRLKDEFIATLAHELRNPLTPVFTGLQVLRLTKNPETSVRTMDIMERQLIQMKQLIDDLLEISRITSGKVLLRRENITLAVAMQAAAEAGRPLLAAENHHLHIHVPEDTLWLNVDPARLSQAIGNLLSNSAKYSNVGSDIILAACREGDDIVIRISDAGMGIPAEMLGKVFDMFTQVNQTLDRAQGGLGIGLAIVRQLVEMHDGTVTAESRGSDLGSTFSIRLPLAPVPEGHVMAPPPALPASVISRRILVIDDNVDGATMLATMLEHSGHVTRLAFSGQEALLIGAAFLPEIVFLDIGLPGMNGYEVAKRFRASPALKNVLLVAVTGWGSADDRRKSKDAGFDMHITKPVEASVFDLLIARIQAALPDQGGVADVADLAD